MHSWIHVAVTSAFLLASVPASALFSNYFEFAVTECTGTCDSFAALAVGTQVAGALEFSNAPGTDWAAEDIQNFISFWTNPNEPTVGYTGDNPTVANPLVLDEPRLTIGTGPVGQDGLTTGGTSIGYGLIDSGTLLLQLDSSPFNANNAWLIIRIHTVNDASFELCLFYDTVGCIEGATRAVAGTGCFNSTPEGCRQTLVPLPAAGWMFALALATLALAPKNGGP